MAIVSAHCFLVIRINYCLTKAMYKEVFPDTTHTEIHGEDTKILEQRLGSGNGE